MIDLLAAAMMAADVLITACQVIFLGFMEGVWAWGLLPEMIGFYWTMLHDIGP